MLSNRLYREYSPGQCYRSVTEMILWLPLSEILLTLERLSKSWQRLVSSKELWLSLILRDIDDVDLKDACEFPDIRDAYLAFYKRKNYLYFWKHKENAVGKYSPADDSLRGITFADVKNLDCSSSRVLLKDGRLLACGGRGGVVMGIAMYSRSTNLIDFSIAKVERKRDMRERKADMELVELNRHIYCFGGHNVRKLPTVERCSVEDFVWEKYGEMPSTPDLIIGVAQWNKIFLACQPANRLQVYDPTQQTFTTLALIQSPFVKGLSILDGSKWILFQDSTTAVVISLATAEINTLLLQGEYELDVNHAFGVRQRSKVYFVSHDQDKEVIGVFALDLRSFHISTSRLFTSY